MMLGRVTWGNSLQLLLTWLHVHCVTQEAVSPIRDGTCGAPHARQWDTGCWDTGCWDMDLGCWAATGLSGKELGPQHPTREGAAAVLRLLCRGTTGLLGVTSTDSLRCRAQPKACMTEAPRQPGLLAFGVHFYFWLFQVCFQSCPCCNSGWGNYINSSVQLWDQKGTWALQGFFSLFLLKLNIFFYLSGRKNE